MNDLDHLLSLFELDLRVVRKADATIEHYTGAARHFAKWYVETTGQEWNPRKTTPEDIKRWRIWMQERYRINGVRNRFIGLRMFLRWMVQSGETDADPTEGIELPRPGEEIKPILSIDAIESTIAMLEKERNYRDAAVISLLFESGMRSKELRTLVAGDIHWKEEFIRLRDTKNHEDRDVPLLYRSHRNLLRLLGPSPDPDEPVFHSRTGKPLTRYVVHSIVKKAFARNGHPNVYPHLIRHSSASILSLSGMDTRDLETIFGWNDPRMSKRYTKSVATARAMKAHRQHHPFSKKG